MPKKPTKNSLTYKEAGVNIDLANTFIKAISPFVKKTERSEVLSSIGHYAGLFDLHKRQYNHPILVASTDGVGTKLKLALEWNRLDGLGQDLVAMSANDILCLGAEPLFFLDYFATGHLDVKQATTIVKGVANACRAIDCALLGGETAEMPGLYMKGDFDIAGFIVGVVEKDAIIDGSKIRPGNSVIGVASSGPHSNGFSLIRRIVEKKKIQPKKKYETLGRPLERMLLEPTRLYVRLISELLKNYSLNGIAHITGGGLVENLPRLLPPNCRAVLSRKEWPLPSLFALLQEWGQLENEEMHRVFNCGIGLMLVVDKSECHAVMNHLRGMQEKAWVIGEITEAKKGKGPIEIL